MGVVYTAEDPRLKRQVAIKLLPPELTTDETANARFLQEAQTASALDHPNIFTIHEINETEVAAILDVRSGDQEPPTHIAVAAPESGQRFARNPWLIVAAAVAVLTAAVWFWLSLRA